MEGNGDGEDNMERQETMHNRKYFWRINFSFFFDCIYIIFYKRVVTALYSFLFNKHVIFYYIFLKQNFSFSLKVSVYKLLTNFICVLLLFAWMVFMLLISSSQIMVDQAV